MRRLSSKLIAILSLGALWGCSSSTGSTEAPGSLLVIGEFLYRSGNDTLEWIELRNDGTAPAPLAGAKVSGAGYEFPDTAASLPAGGRLLLVNNAALFAARHPGVAIHGVFPGRLSDEGERLALESGGEVLFSLGWSGDEPWPQACAREGASMVWLGGDSRLPTSWAASAQPGGTPGFADLPASDPGILVSEVLPAAPGNPGFVELWNTSVVAIDIGGWILRDEATVPESLVIAQGVTIPAGGRLVLSSTATNTQLAWARFAPSRSGGRVTFARRGTGVSHSLSWPALADGVSWVRIGTFGTGPLAAPTPGSGESLVSAGEAFVSEVCYHPATGAEYLEIASLVDTTLHLGAADTALSWTLGGLGLRFSAVDTIPPRGRLVVVGAGVTESDFRAAAAIPATVPVVGASGRLDDAGERVELGQPLRPVTTAAGRLSWKERVVDAAVWAPADPWPSGADGGGSCLERVSPFVPGDSPLAWKASTPSAGR